MIKEKQIRDAAEKKARELRERLERMAPVIAAGVAMTSRDVHPQIVAADAVAISLELIKAIDTCVG